MFRMFAILLYSLFLSAVNITIQTVFGAALALLVDAIFNGVISDTMLAFGYGDVKAWKYGAVIGFTGFFLRSKGGALEIKSS